MLALSILRYSSVKVGVNLFMALPLLVPDYAFYLPLLLFLSHQQQWVGGEVRKRIERHAFFFYFWKHRLFAL
jgi:hypothetical protein